MPSIKTTMTTSSQIPPNEQPTITSNDPTRQINSYTIGLGQRPQGDDEFNTALKKLENTFNVLVDRLNALEESLNKLQETNKKLDEQIASMYPSNNLNISYAKPLVLTPDMEVKDGHK